MTAIYVLERLGKAMLEIEACRGEVPAGVAVELQHAHKALKTAALHANRWHMRATAPQAGLPGSSGSSKADERTNTEHGGAQEHN